MRNEEEQQPQNSLIPALRFPEFQDAGEWEEKTLGEVGNIVASGDLDANSFSSEPTEIHVYPIYSNSITKEGLYGFNTYPKYKSNCVTITARGTLGVAFVRNTEFVGIGRLLVVSDLSNVDSVFFKENWNHFAKIPLENGGIPQLTAIKAKLVSLLYPSLPEQQKIADCLSSLDEWITAEGEKLEALKAHKKGLMQQLFPAQGETVPRLRFPEFQDADEWEEKTLGEMAEFLKGKGISKADISVEGTLPCIRYGELYTHYGEIINKVVSYTNQPRENLILSKVNDVIIPSSGETREDIATASCVMESGIALGGDLNIIRSKTNGVFLSYYLNNVKNTEIAKLAQGNAVVHLYNSQLQKLVINLPSLPEQRKIADCLSSLDELITAQGEKVALLKAHKKGLMQQLFPKTSD